MPTGTPTFPHVPPGVQDKQRDRSLSDTETELELSAVEMQKAAHRRIEQLKRELQAAETESMSFQTDTGRSSTV